MLHISYAPKTILLVRTFEMNIGQGQAHESHFGPTSELIDIAQFLRSVQPDSGCTSSQSSDNIRGCAQEEWSTLSDETKRAIQAECRYVHTPLLRLNTMHAIITTHRSLGRRDGSVFAFGPRTYFAPIPIQHPCPLCVLRVA